MVNLSFSFFPEASRSLQLLVSSRVRPDRNQASPPAAPVGDGEGLAPALAIGLVLGFVLYFRFAQVESWSRSGSFRPDPMRPGHLLLCCVSPVAGAAAGGGEGSRHLQ